MRKLNYIFIVVTIIFLFTGCGVISQSQVTKGQLYPILYKEHLKSILVLPARNTTTSVDATDHFRYTITKPLAEAGYYVLPVHLVDSFFKSENLSDAEIIRNISVSKLKQIFNADMILYVDILQWDTNYSVLQSSVGVNILFSLVNSNTEEEVWTSNVFAQSSTSVDTNSPIGLVVSIVGSALNTSVDYTQLSSDANIASVKTLPFGSYHNRFKSDKDDIIKYLGYDFNWGKPIIVGNNLYIEPTVIEGNRYGLLNQIQNGTLAMPKEMSGSGVVLNYTYLVHSKFDDYYIKKNDKVRHKFFMYEKDIPYLIVGDKKVFITTKNNGQIVYEKKVLTVSPNGNIPFYEEESNTITTTSKKYIVYSFHIDSIEQLKLSSK
jgi:hypothetical protein